MWLTTGTRGLAGLLSKRPAFGAAALVLIRPLGSFASHTQGEKEVENKLRASLSVARLCVSDVSGGCGTMYHVDVAAEEFRGKSTVQQHQLITKLLGEDIKKWHGFTLNTSVPDSQ